MGKIGKCSRGGIDGGKLKNAQHCLKGRQGVNLETECKMPDEEKWRGWGVLPLLLTGHTGHTALQNTFKTLDTGLN